MAQQPTREELAIWEVNKRLQSEKENRNGMAQAGEYIPVGRKDDQDKIRLELVPPSLLWAVGTILSFGAKKYGPRNWEKGFAWSRAFGALLRHLFAWWNGEGTDPETGKSHLWHAACELAFLIEFEEAHTGEDDRP